MDEAAIERLRIAIRVLNLRYDDFCEKATETEIETLKSYLGGDVTNMAVEDIASAVIRRELKLDQSNEGAPRIKRSSPPRGLPPLEQPPQPHHQQD